MWLGKKIAKKGKNFGTWENHTKLKFHHPSIKFYWNTVTPIRVDTVYGLFSHCSG